MRTDEELSSLAFLSVPVLAPQMSWEPGREQAAQGHRRVECRYAESLTRRTGAAALFPRGRCGDDCGAGHVFARRHGPAAAPCRAPGGQAACGRGFGRRHTCRVREHVRGVEAGQLCRARARSGPAPGRTGYGKSPGGGIHPYGKRAQRLPLVRFYASRLQSPGCGQLTEEQAERELFGYRKGAFPGAVQTRKGLFELANCSTLFIEDIDKLSLSHQAQILHVLQEQSVVRMGGGQAVGVDVRFICSSSADLEKLVAQGAFLEDLYNRITVFPIALPPLRERPEDILPLADMFLKASAEALGRTVERISTPAQDFFCNTRGRAMPESWPSA